ncbi:hypothetical protein VPNG_09384 [Cytospora leucostoma]|uniref:Homeobox domain-containing protein n=1 Tax=Cytospora leucostoma TaxID=1230097 RepID=A0A423VTM0_9PEZI|nr:hypothetical protein VPNG_09384 [Cytospora leucostoma]
MPIAPEDSVMEEFVNWDNAEPAADTANLVMPCGTNMDLQPVQDNFDFDLALANIDGDDFSFWALEHFETSNFDLAHVQTQTVIGPTHDVAALDLNDVKHAPCDACQASAFTCKRIEEGQYKGYCTSCVALRHNCSFGLASPSGHTAPVAFPSHPYSSIRPEDGQQDNSRSSSSPDLAGFTAGAESGKDNSPRPPAVPKIGARFSRESVRILKAWLSTHSNRPYPSDEERETLQRQTGLNKTQIANWLANARRRSKGKYQSTRSTSPNVRGFSGAIEIPPRRGTPALEHMNPLQRWENSPPENEPASVMAIASALNNCNSSTGSGLNSPYSLNYTDDDADRSCKGSSASSFGTSPSSGSFASKFSHQSQGSLGSFGSLQQRGRRRRRRRVAPRQGDEKIGLNTPLKTFQCTFCTETFRTKHDWQRHEKSLHLSLERWVCCPKGPKAFKSDTAQTCCAFCSAVDPDNAHIEGHNYTSCQERQLDERTFYRKDHLRQHLKLVHNTKYLNWSMDSWKVATPEIKSRCGFCGVVLASWVIRVDHLAEHFKTGSDMKDWKGDWGFEPMVLSVVENALPPWLIQDERNLPLPYQASQRPPESPRSAYELIELELSYYLQNMRHAGAPTPSEEDLQYEACRIIYASEVSSRGGLASRASWLRDLLMSSDEIKRRAQLSPIRGAKENCLGQLKINGKDNIFEDCPLEKHLGEFVKARTLLGLTITDYELQVEVCRILRRTEESSSTSSEDITNFMLHLIYRDQTWLRNFRRRAGVCVSADGLESDNRIPANSTDQKYSRLESELTELATDQQVMAFEPSDHLLQLSNRMPPPKSNSPPTALEPLTLGLDAARKTPSPLYPALGNKSDLTVSPLSGTSANTVNSAVARSSDEAALPRQHLFLNGSGNYRHIVKELARYVASCMSPNNPARHTPTDEELRHQARWILYDDGDPFNVTVADNVEWLTRFKRSTAILATTDGPGLPDDMGIAAIGAGLRKRWQSSGSGFTPPSSLLPQAPVMHLAALGNGGLSAEIGDNSAGIDIQNTLAIGSSKASNNGAVFNSQEFETRLMEFAVAEVASSGRMPADEALTARAKEIAGMEVWQAETTAADNPVLLGKFKALVVNRVQEVLGGRDNNGPRPRINTVPSPPPAVRTPERGMDAIDPGLLPDLPPADMETATKSDISPLPRDVQVAISERRLIEILREFQGHL